MENKMLSNKSIKTAKNMESRKKRTNKYNNTCEMKTVGMDIRSHECTSINKRKPNDSISQSYEPPKKNKKNESTVLKSKSVKRSKRKKRAKKCRPETGKKVAELAEESCHRALTEVKLRSTSSNSVPVSKSKWVKRKKTKNGAKSGLAGSDEAVADLAEESSHQALTEVKVTSSDSVKAAPSLADRMKEKLNSGRFRYLNEQLYTQTGDEAMKMFCEDPEAFHVYHSGFQSQVARWPRNPVQRVIQYIKNRPQNLVVADLGCGNAELAQSVPHKVHSFDLIALNEHVTACDMANLPLEDASVDVCVFCLSLMGTNLVEYIVEANRVLRAEGTLLVAEVLSRFTSPTAFATKLAKLGFLCVKQDVKDKMFVWFVFRKTKCLSTDSQLPRIELTPCVYKKR